MMSDQNEKEMNEPQMNSSEIGEALEQSEEVAEVGQASLNGQEIIEALQQELSEARSKADEYLDGWQRSRADFTNYKKRIERDQSQTYQVAAGSVIRRFLTVVDDLERALKNRPQKGAGASWADGIELIYRKLINTLESEGVTIIQAQGQVFDPNFHEAVVSEDNLEYESGAIIEVLQQGYMLGEKVLRPAMVRVAR